MIKTASPLSASYLRLLDFAEAFKFVKTPTSSEMDRTVRDLQTVQGSALIIGGLAAAHHGLERTTDDVDILYENRDVHIFKRLKKHFKVVRRASNGWCELRHAKTGVRLEIIPEGGLGQYGFIPFCDTVAGANGYISLAGLLWLKLVAGRGKDETDVVELYKKDPEGVSATRPILPTEFHERFDALIVKAQIEMDNDPYRHPEKFMKQMLPDGTVIDLSEKKKKGDSSGSGIVSEAAAGYSKGKKKKRKSRV